MRQFIRHPSSIPVHLNLSSDSPTQPGRLENVSAGGLCFRSAAQVQPGHLVTLKMIVGGHRVDGEVLAVWCRPGSYGYEVGARVPDSHDRMRAPMIEQICRIERYRRRMVREHGRELSSEEAAREWVLQYAGEGSALQ